MNDQRPPFRASEPSERSRQASPVKLLILVGIGLALFLGTFAAQRMLLARNDDQLTPTPSAAIGTVEPLVVRDVPDYAALTRRSEVEQPEPAVTPRTDPEADARRRAEEAARTSPLIFERSRPDGGQGASRPQGARPRLAGLSEQLRSLAAPAGHPGVAQSGQGALDAAQAYAGVVLDRPYLPPASAHLIQAGTLIPAALITGVNSDLPGEIVAQVTEPIFDSLTGNTLLVPAGARLLGRYDSLIGYGQDRVFIIWDRLLMPNGYSIVLDELMGTDRKGQAGVADTVDHHVLRLLSAVLLSSFVTAGANLVENSDETGFRRDLGDTAAQQALSIGGRIIDRQLDVQPTITIRPGWTVRVLANRDVVLMPYEE